MGHSPLLFARVLRLTGVSLFVVFILVSEFLYFLSFSNPSPELSRIFVIGIVVALVSFAVGVSTCTNWRPYLSAGPVA